MSNNIRYMHVRNFGRGGRRNATVAYTVDDAARQVRVGVALCSSKDNFVKKEGRSFAAGRLIVMPTAFSFEDIGSDRYRLVDTFLRRKVIETFGDSTTKAEDISKIESRS